MRPLLFTFKLADIPCSESTSIFNNIKISPNKKITCNKNRVDKTNICLKSYLKSKNLFDLDIFQSKNKHFSNQNQNSSCKSSKTSSDSNKTKKQQPPSFNSIINKHITKGNLQNMRNQINKQNYQQTGNTQNTRKKFLKVSKKISKIHELIEKQNANIQRISQHNHIIRNQVNLQDESIQEQNIIYNLKSKSAIPRSYQQKESNCKQLSQDSKNHKYPLNFKQNKANILLKSKNDSFLQGVRNLKKFKYYHSKNHNILVSNSLTNKNQRLKWFKQSKQFKKRQNSPIKNINKNIIICVQDLKVNEQNIENLIKKNKITNPTNEKNNKNRQQKYQSLNQTLLRKTEEQCLQNSLKRRSSCIEARQKSALSSTNYSHNNSKIISGTASDKKEKMLIVFEKTQHLLRQYKQKCHSLQKKKEKIQFKYNQILDKLSQITKNVKTMDILKQNECKKVDKQSKKHKNYKNKISQRKNSKKNRKKLVK